MNTRTEREIRHRLAPWTKKGHANHWLYKRWLNIISMCYDPESKRYEWHGRVGITVCDAWRRTPEVFIAWAKSVGAKRDWHLKRLNETEGFSPANCAWVGKGRVARDKEFLKWEGEAKHNGVPSDVFYARVRIGWTFKEAAERPAKIYSSRFSRVTIKGETKSASAWAKELGLNKGTVWQRITKYKIDPLKALEIDLKDID